MCSASGGSDCGRNAGASAAGCAGSSGVGEPGVQREMMPVLTLIVKIFCRSYVAAKTSSRPPIRPAICGEAQSRVVQVMMRESGKILVQTMCIFWGS